MVKRDFADMVIFFCQKVSEMDIRQKHKMELLGMITAIEMKHDELVPKWIPVTEALPEEDTEVLVTVHFDGYKDAYTNLKPTDYVGIASQIDGEWAAYDDEYKVAPRKHHVIAWMTLIEPWRGE